MRASLVILCITLAVALAAPKPEATTGAPAYPSGPDAGKDYIPKSVQQYMDWSKYTKGMGGGPGGAQGGPPAPEPTEAPPAPRTKRSAQGPLDLVSGIAQPLLAQPLQGLLGGGQGNDVLGGLLGK